MGNILVNVFLGVCGILIVNIFVQIARVFDQKDRIPDGFNRSTTVIQRNGSMTLYKDYGGEVRYINGKPLSTNEDLERWWVLKGFSDAIQAHLYQLEQELITGKFTDSKSHLTEWHEYYAKYRHLCIQHGIWNAMLEETERFIPTKIQLQKEEALYQRIERDVITGETEIKRVEEDRRSYEDKCAEILDYIGSQYGHVAVRHQMITALSKGDASRKSELLKVCKRMVWENILTESTNSDGKYVVRKKRKSRQSVTVETQPEKAEFSKELYASIPRKTLYKVEYTVGKPSCVDREKGTCVFISQTCGVKYHTSLSNCSCPAFNGPRSVPCKHMVALAKYLGYCPPT